MQNYQLLVWLLPIVFMLHDFEEIIFMENWFSHNREKLLKRVPKLAPKILSHTDQLTTARIALGVACMFLLVVAVTLISVISGVYYVWLAGFIVFSIHLFVHIAQSLVLRSYVPAVATSILALPYSIWGFATLMQANVFTPMDYLWCTGVGIFITGIYLYAVHQLMTRVNL